MVPFYDVNFKDILTGNEMVFFNFGNMFELLLVYFLNKSLRLIKPIKNAQRNFLIIIINIQAPFTKNNSKL